MNVTTLQLHPIDSCTEVMNLHKNARICSIAYHWFVSYLDSEICSNINIKHNKIVLIVKFFELCRLCE